MKTYSFYAGDGYGEIAPSGQSIEEIFGCQDVAAAVYFTELFNDRDQQCWVHDDEIDADCNPQVNEDDLTEDEFCRLDSMRTIEWHESDGYACGYIYPPGTPDGIVLEVELNAVAIRGRFGGSTRLVTDSFPMAQARLAAMAYPMAEVPA